MIERQLFSFFQIARLSELKNIDPLKSLAAQVRNCVTFFFFEKSAEDQVRRYDLVFATTKEPMSDAKRSSDDIQKEISRLQQEFEVAQQSEIDAFLAEVKPKIAKFKLTAEQLGVAAPRASQNEKKSAVAKSAIILYKKGDLTWSGRGRKPNWVKEEGEEIEKYRVPS